MAEPMRRQYANESDITRWLPALANEKDDDKNGGISKTFWNITQQEISGSVT